MSGKKKQQDIHSFFGKKQKLDPNDGKHELISEPSLQPSLEVNPASKDDKDTTSTQVAEKMKKTDADLVDEYSQDTINNSVFPSQPCQPSDISSIPPQVQGQRIIRFKAKWFRDFKWLHLDPVTKYVLCHTCSKADHMGLLSPFIKHEPAFISNGFKNWNHALERFKQHEKSKGHCDAIQQLLQNRVQQPVTTLLSKQVSDNQKITLEWIRTVLTSVVYLARQGMAFRGHKDSEGNLNQLLLTRCRDNPQLLSWFNKTTNFTSHQVIEEMLQMLSHAILRVLRDKIKESVTFSIMVDGTQDLTGDEQESICIRFVDEELNAYEVFIGFYSPDKTTGEALRNLIVDALMQLGLEIKYVRFQTYDGAANMSGQIKGCQTLIKESNPLALYVHCGSHVTHLIAKDASNAVKEVQCALKHVQDLGSFHKKSGKAKKIFQKHNSNLLVVNDGEDDEGHDDNNNTSTVKSQTITSIKPLCPTRWCTRSRAIGSVLDNLPAVLTSLNESIEELSGESINTAERLFNAFCKENTLVVLIMVRPILNRLECLTGKFQGKDVSANDMLTSVEKAISHLESLRSEKSFSSIMTELKTLNKTVSEVAKINLDSCTRPRLRFISQYTKSEKNKTVEDHFRRLYYQFVDQVIMGLRERFNQTDLKKYSEIEKLLLNSDPLNADYSILNDYPEVSVTSLKSELHIIHNGAKNSNTSITSVLQMKKHLLSMNSSTSGLFGRARALI